MIATSMGSNSIAQYHNGQWSYIDVGARTWGVCILWQQTTELVILTHPLDTKMTILYRFDPSQPFTYNPYAVIPNVPAYCTEIIEAAPDTITMHARFLVASRGFAPSGAEPWQHAVYEYQLGTPLPIKTFITENEPRGMAVSPDGSVLFVGHIKGAFHPAGVTPPNHWQEDTEHDHNVFDGGSILEFEYATGNVLRRFAVGSPVRDLAIWPPKDAPVEAHPTDGSYRLYFPNLGDANQSEAPSRGGRVIPNVISSIGFNGTTNVPIAGDWRDAVFDHDADKSDNALDAAVLHEKIALRWKRVSVSEYEGELWVTNSASGTVSRAKLDSFGRLNVMGSVDLTALNCTDCFFPVAISRSTNKVNSSAADASNSIVEFDLITPQAHLVLGDHSSRPLGIVFSRGPETSQLNTDPDDDRIHVVTNIGQQHVEVDPNAMGIVSQVPIGAAPVAVDEKNFFTFGRGFDFRENPNDDNPFPDPLVQTISCGTCHVDGHLDGKIRGTVSNGVMSNDPKQVAVPSVFDVGATEWIFFDGGKSIIDGRTLQNETFQNHFYLSVGEGGIFGNTRAFTNVVSTPASPAALDGQLTSQQQRGRYNFQSMNCTRCHSGPVGTPQWTRAEDDGGATAVLDLLGPLPDELTSDNRLLFDPTQSFVTNPGGQRRDAHSFRNQTDVGTRTDGTKSILNLTFALTGVNTPALAGSWDSSPYFHDGRYRTLEEVLQHTWVDPAVPDPVAAPLLAPLLSVVDNSTGVNTFSLDPDLHNFGGSAPIAFETHKHDRPSGRLSVSEFLTPGQQDDLLAFLRAASSQTDLCPPITIANVTSLNNGNCSETTVSWTTSGPTPCDVRVIPFGTTIPILETTTALGEQHSVLVPTNAGEVYKITMSFDTTEMPAANLPVCRMNGSLTYQWNTFECEPPPGKAGVIETGVVVATNAIGQKTTVRFGMAAPGDVSLEVYDVRGRKVRTLATGRFDRGYHLVDWDQKANNGVRAGSGIYFMVFESGSKRDLRRLVVIR